METVKFFSKDTFVEYWRKYFPALLPWSMVFKIRSGLTVPLSTGDIHMSTVTTMFEFIARLKAILILIAAFLSAMITSYTWFAAAIFAVLFLDYVTFYQFKIEGMRRKQYEVWQQNNTVPATS